MKYLLIILVFFFPSCVIWEDIKEPKKPIPVETFIEIENEFEHVWGEDSHPFTGAAVLDIDNDGNMEVFIGGSAGQNDFLLTLQDGRLQNIIQGTSLSSKEATYGSFSIDIDNDKNTDLLVARENGVFLYHNNGDGTFEQRKIAVSFQKDAVPVAIAAADIDLDGDVDLYVSSFVQINAFESGKFNDPNHAKLNHMLLNDGNLNFEDVTNKTGTAGLQNTFHSSFVDLNQDGLKDLVLSQNTGEVEIFKNLGNLRFERVELRTGFGFWMGLAIGDYNSDGKQDLFFTNAGNSIPASFTAGDIREDQKHELEWLLLKNEGDFKFSNQTKAAGLDNYGFAWGAVFEDLNLDGKLDLLVGQNYLKWPIHKLFKLPNKAFVQQEGKFFHREDLKLENEEYGQSPVIADLNGDGLQDVIWINMDGPIKVYLNQSKKDFITFSFPDQERYMDCAIELDFADGSSISKKMITGQGLMTDQSHEIMIAIPEGKKIKEARLKLINGDTSLIPNTLINQKTE